MQENLQVYLCRKNSDEIKFNRDDSMNNDIKLKHPIVIQV